MMNNRQIIWLWVSAAVSLIVGFILVMSDCGAGWFLIIMGIIYIGVSTRIGQSRAMSNPRVARWGLIGPLLLVLSAVILSVVVLMK
jgi:O-antigen ligase